MSVSRMPPLPPSSRAPVVDGLRTYATLAIPSTLHERTRWLGSERARIVASSAQSFDLPEQATGQFLPDDATERELLWLALPPVGNDTGDVDVRLWVFGAGTLDVRIVATDASGAQVAESIAQVISGETLISQWLTVSMTLPEGTAALRILVAAAADTVMFVGSVMVEAAPVATLTDGTAAPAEWAKLSALAFEDDARDLSDDVHTIRRLAEQHAHVAGRMPRTLAAHSLASNASASAQVHRYRLRGAPHVRGLRVHVFAESFAEDSTIGIRLVAAPSADAPSSAGGPNVVDTATVTADAPADWHTVDVLDSEVLPDVSTGLFELMVFGTPDPGGGCRIYAIRVEEAALAPNDIRHYDVTDGTRLACAPTRAIPARRFLTGEPVVDSYVRGADQETWNDRRSAVSNALLRAIDHTCVYVADTLSREPITVAFDQLADEEKNITGTHAAGTDPATLWRMRHRVSLDATEITVMARCWITYGSPEQAAWISLWRDGVEVVPARAVATQDGAWQVVGTIPVTPGATHDLELRAGLGTLAEPYDEASVRHALVMPGIVAWELPTDTSPRRVYWHGETTAEGASVLDLEVPETRDFDVRKVRVRVARASAGAHSLTLTYAPGTDDEVTRTLTADATGLADDVWFSDYRIGDETPAQALTAFNGARSAATWRLTCSDAVLTRFALEVE